MPQAAVVRTRWALAGGLVAWVLVFGALYALGTPLAHYHKGNGNILGDTTIPHWLAAHRTPILDKVSFLGSEAGNTHAILAVGLIAGATALAIIRQWRPVVFLLATMVLAVRGRLPLPGVYDGCAAAAASGLGLSLSFWLWDVSSMSQAGSCWL